MALPHDITCPHVHMFSDQLARMPSGGNRMRDRLIILKTLSKYRVDKAVRTKFLMFLNLNFHLIFCFYFGLSNATC